MSLVAHGEEPYVVSKIMLNVTKAHHLWQSPNELWQHQVIKTCVELIGPNIHTPKPASKHLTLEPRNQVITLFNKFEE